MIKKSQKVVFQDLSELQWSVLWLFFFRTHCYKL